MYSIAFPDAPQAFKETLGCAAVVEGSAFENRSDLSANARSSRGTNKLILNVSQGAKSAFLTYASDLEIGANKRIPLAVISDGADYLVARSEQGAGVTAVILNMRTQKAVVSYTGQGMLGMTGTSLLVQCR